MDHTDNQLRACVKALDEVVSPALAPGNAQAAEQLFLVTDYLKFLRSRLDLLHDRHRFELQHYVTMGAAIVDDVEAAGVESAARLADALAAGRELLDRPDAGTAELRAGAEEVAGAVTAVLRAVGSSPGSFADGGRSVERRVVDLSGDKIRLDRAWHLPQGLDGEPASVLSLEEAFGRG